MSEPNKMSSEDCAIEEIGNSHCYPLVGADGFEFVVVSLLRGLIYAVLAVAYAIRSHK